MDEQADFSRLWEVPPERVQCELCSEPASLECAQCGLAICDSCAQPNCTARFLCPECAQELELQG